MRAIWCTLVSALASDPLVVNTDAGPVRGLSVDGVRKFLGVPFATCERFGAPEPPAKWTEIRDATQYGPGCQQGHPGHNPDVPKNQSEECLNVNIFAPDGASNLPVLIWYYGGAFKEGSNQGPYGLYDGSNLAKLHDVIIIAVNYRLHVYGFLALPSDSDTGVKGNFGIMDQQEAMRWVQRNAKAFGGDPSRVTLWGESAGAMSIGIHMASNKTAGLFQGAIMESNLAGYRYRTSEQAGLYGTYFLKYIPDCEKLKGSALMGCLRKQNTTTIHNAASKAENEIWVIVKGNWAHWLDAVLSWTPVVDGDVLPDQVTSVFRAGQQQKVPLLAGTNSNEGATFVYVKDFPAVSGLELKAAQPVIFGSDNGPRVWERYNAPLFKSARNVTSRMVTDYWFRCSTESLAEAQQAAGVPSFVYRFDHSPSFSQLWPQFGLPTQCETEVCHMAEIPFVFGNYANYTAEVTEEEKTLASVLGSLWMTFAKNHSASVGPVQWPAFDKNSKSNLLIDIGTKDAPKLTVESAKDMCDFWDSVGYLHAEAPHVTLV
mmetsp:Transcript_29647/g.71228  ORF Transcript_29647/g.71228 Transcript_29647/m.71228 type:complete len:543 (-) Transcript_29647:150-1778(-)